MTVEKHPTDEVDSAATVADALRDLTQLGALDLGENDDGCEYVASYPRDGAGDETFNEREVV